MRLKFYECFKEEQAAIKQRLPKKVTAVFTEYTIQASGDKEPPGTLISIRTQSQIPDNWSGKLKGILTRAQGYDHLIAYRKKTKTQAALGYLGGYCARAVAEQAVMAMLCLMRKLNQQRENFQSFSRGGLTGVECLGKNALIVGVGHIGKEIVRVAHALGLNVKGVDVKKTIKNLEYVNLSRGIVWADVIFVAADLNDKTQRMIDYKLLKRSRRKPFLINVARGEITPAADLCRLLKANILSGLYLDVFENESRLAGYLSGNSKAKDKTINALLKLSKDKNVLFTPHNAFNSKEALARKAALSVEAITSFMAAGTFPKQISSR